VRRRRRTAVMKRNTAVQPYTLEANQYEADGNASGTGLLRNVTVSSRTRTRSIRSWFAGSPRTSTSGYTSSTPMTDLGELSRAGSNRLPTMMESPSASSAMPMVQGEKQATRINTETSSSASHASPTHLSPSSRFHHGGDGEPDIQEEADESNAFVIQHRDGGFGHAGTIVRELPPPYAATSPAESQVTATSYVR